jgi:cysteine desulfurase
MRSIFLDFCSTTPIAASVRESMLPFLGEFFGHPSSAHWFGRAAQEAIEDSRSNVACLIGCHPSEVIYTSGGTEGVNLGLIGAARAIERALPDEKWHLITTVLEHMAVRKCVEHLEQTGWEVTVIGCDANGVIRAEDFSSAIRPNTVLASVIHASHQFGTIQPLAAISELCVADDIILHTDAAQSVGKIAVDIEELGVDLLSFSGHKLYAPKGIGGLFVRMGTAVEPILFGEGNEGGLRPGTENVPHIVGLGQAAKLLMTGAQSSADRLAHIRDRFHHQLESLLGLPLKVHGEHANRLPHVLSFELPGVTAQALQQRLPEICFGPTGIALDSPSAKRWNSFAAMGLSDQQAAKALRISIGWTTSEEELQQALQLIAAAHDGFTDEPFAGRPS